jgi:hypothetical protein
MRLSSEEKAKIEEENIRLRGEHEEKIRKITD